MKFTLDRGLLRLGCAYFRKGDFPRAIQSLSSALDLSRTWQFTDLTALVAAALGAAHALDGRAGEALPLIASAVEEFRRRQFYNRPAFILLCVGMTYLAAKRIDEAASRAQEGLELTRRLGARGNEAHALCLMGDIAMTRRAGDAEGYYHQALALAEPREMRPLVAHCHLGLGKLCRHRGDTAQAQERLTIAAAMYREMDMAYGWSRRRLKYNNSDRLPPGHLPANNCRVVHAAAASKSSFLNPSCTMRIWSGGYSRANANAR